MNIEEFKQATAAERAKVMEALAVARADFDGDHRTKCFSATWSSGQTSKDGSEIAHDMRASKPDSRWQTWDELNALPEKSICRVLLMGLGADAYQVTFSGQIGDAVVEVIQTVRGGETTEETRSIPL